MTVPTILLSMLWVAGAPVQQGLHEYLMLMGGSGDSFQLTLHDPEAGICVDAITVGVVDDGPTVH